jgi:hypothetical protein
MIWYVVGPGAEYEMGDGDFGQQRARRLAEQLNAAFDEGRKAEHAERVAWRERPIQDGSSGSDYVQGSAAWRGAWPVLIIEEGSRAALRGRG